MSALRADHLRPTRTLCVRSPDIRLRHRPRRAQLRGRALEFDAQGVHGEPFLFDPVEPEVLPVHGKCSELAMVAEREFLPAPGDLEPRGHVGHVHQALDVVAGDPGSRLVLLAVFRTSIPDPVADPPAGSAGHRAESQAVSHPFGKRQLTAGRPRRVGKQRRASGSAGCGHTLRAPSPWCGCRGPPQSVLQKVAGSHPRSTPFAVQRSRAISLCISWRAGPTPPADWLRGAASASLGR